MRWEDIDGAIWTIPTEDERRATLACWCFPSLPLEIINAQPRFASNPYVFAGEGFGHIKGLVTTQARIRRQA